MNDNTPTPQQQQTFGWHMWALRLGFMGTIPVIPPGAELHEDSKVDPDTCGKVPGDFYAGKWNGLGRWPSFVMSEFMATRFDQLHANVGLIQGRDWVSFDADLTDPVLANAIHQHIWNRGGAQWPVRVGQEPKKLWLFRVDGDPIKSMQVNFRIDDNPDNIQGLEIRGTKTQVVIAGTHPTGVPYQWFNWDMMSLHAFPSINAELLHELVEECCVIIEQHGWKRGRKTRHNNADGTGSDLGAEPFDPALVPEVMAYLKNDELSYDDWRRVAFALKASLGGNGLPYFQQWSALATKNDPLATDRLWMEIEPDNSVGFGTLVTLARECTGGVLPGNLDERVRLAAKLKGAVQAGMPMDGQILLPPGVDGPVTAPDAPAMPPMVPVNREFMPHAVNGNQEVIINSMANVVAYMHNTPEWHDCFAWDSFARRIIVTVPFPGMIDPEPGRALTKNDQQRIRAALLRHPMFPRIQQSDVDTAITLRAEDNRFEPVQQYLTGLVWDGVRRLDGWLVTYGGVDPSGGAYVAQVGRKWLIGAVARAMDPGCQMDNGLILEGEQGVGKSSLLRALVPVDEWFTDSLPGLDNERIAVNMAGKWIVEMAELTSILKSELEDARHFMTRRYDEQRTMHTELQARYPRRCVLAGSTNRDDYLKDAAGERRFWIVECTLPLDVAGLIRDRDQIWAEAYQAYSSGEKWHLDRDIAAQAKIIQQERVEEDEWHVRIANYLEGRDVVTIPEIKSVIGDDALIPRQRPSAKKRIESVLKRLGWKHTKGDMKVTDPNRGNKQFRKKV
ncbi:MULTISPECIES: VapE domain-containing protein [unclassified Ruegeria]|uniref:VapE domain-containing protein n=1 Tax=unclassified Ruegeria TaxID=2625375 RepID=UPI001491536F|nr:MULTISPECIES: VapE domain-containing protein [unclassified Ruegeria]NOD87905.1 hypothetical protein [Ruegeria sp. HKCCD4318]NOE14275.1 hypothetical protein [Ruegeria sp. HKCCD4318-2]NOG08368.1 hypothetical protein [Ruegeria sp. HKCCD4315]